MLKTNILTLFLTIGATLSAQHTPTTATTAAPMPEKHLKNVRQLTFGGDNAEAYWSPDSKWLTFQSNNKAWGLECDQIFAMKV
ncbi:MAG: PD40 domain-containing protein, partial [Saprospiraceae bacterium]|nr:PD40 domain-containing protein [Saprospiraceae bacterium]